MKNIIKLSIFMMALPLSFGATAQDSLPEQQLSSSDVRGLAAQKVSNHTTETASLPKRPFSIHGITSENVRLLMSLGGPFIIYREAQDSLTDVFIIESDEYGVSFNVRNEKKKSKKIGPSCFNNVTPTIAGGREVTIPGTIIEAILTCSNSFKFAEGTIVANASSMNLNFLNPGSLISGIVLEFDPEKSYKVNNLSLGSIQGRASFLVNEKSELEFIGFKKITIIFNLGELKKLSDEGRL